MLKALIFDQLISVVSLPLQPPPEIGGCASMLLEGDLRDVITPQVSRLLLEAALVGVCFTVFYCGLP